MILSNTQIRRILLAGGVIFLFIKFRAVLMPKKPLDADGKDNNTINRAVNKIKNGAVEVTSTPNEIKDMV